MELFEGSRRRMAELPSFGYWRAFAIVNHEHMAPGASGRVNFERAYRATVDHASLLPRAPRLRQLNRVHNSKVVVTARDSR